MHAIALIVEYVVRQISDQIKRWRYGDAALGLLLYEHQPIELKDPEDPDLIRRLSDRALHRWLGQAVSQSSRTLLEREVRRREARPAYLVSVAAVLVSIVSLIGTVLPLAKRDSTNDQRCLALQRDMLSAHPRIGNSADVFQALGCRPQGQDRRIFVPPTDRERAAGKPLPWGGYPPSR